MLHPDPLQWINIFERNSKRIPIVSRMIFNGKQVRFFLSSHPTVSLTLKEYFLIVGERLISIKLTMNC